MAEVDALQARVEHLQKVVKNLRAENAILQSDQTGNGLSLEPKQNRGESSSHAHFPAVYHGSVSCRLPPLREADSNGAHNGQNEDTSQLVDDIANIFSELKLTKSGEMSWFGPSSNLNLDDAAITSNNEKESNAHQSEDIADKPIWDKHNDPNGCNRSDDLFSQQDVDLMTGFEADSSLGVSLEPKDTLAREDPHYETSVKDHLLSLYWTWQHGFFVLVTKNLFVADLDRARSQNATNRRSKFYSPLLLYALLAHAAPLSRKLDVESGENSSKTSGDRYSKRAKRLLETEIEYPSITTVQALALMGSREAGCGRNGLGWLYSGMSFRMALDLGLHLSCDELVKSGQITQDEADSRLRTFWGCYAYDKSWSAYLGKPESIPAHLIEDVPWPTISAEEENELWVPYGEETTPSLSARDPMQAYPSSTTRQIIAIQGILGSIVRNLYSASGKGQRPNYSDMITKLHCELLAWLRELPSDLKVRNHGFSASHLLPHVLVMHILYHTATILLFRPFISQMRSDCLPASFDPLGTCTNSAVKIVTLVKSYKRDYSLQFCHNMAVHGLFTASTIHLVNVVSKIASYEHSARQHLFRSIELMREMGDTWQSACRCLQVIWSLMEKHAINIRQAAVSDRAQPSLNTMSLDEDDYPNNLNLDYTYESRSRQQLMDSMPSLPQLIAPDDCDLSGYGQMSQSIWRNLDGIQDQSWNSAPGTLNFEPRSYQNLSSVAMQMNEPNENESFTQPEFDMSIFDTTGVGANTSEVLDMNQWNTTNIPSVKMNSPDADLTGSFFNNLTAFGDDVTHQNTLDHASLDAQLSFLLSGVTDEPTATNINDYIQ